MTSPSQGVNGAVQPAVTDLSHLPRERRVTMLGLAALIFFTTCGGAFGLEPLIGAIGPAWAVAFIIITPFVWSLPTALMVAELASLMPEEGGYYVWVRQAFGPLWAVQHAFWAISTAIVWLAMYPVLFASYCTFFFPSLSSNAPHVALIRWLIALFAILTGMSLNLRGSRNVGRFAGVGTYLVLGAFVVMLALWLKHSHAPTSFVGIIRSDLASGHQGALLLGISVAIFNYSGWDNASTYAAEVNEPQRNYPRAIAIALTLLLLSYLIPVLAGITISTDPSVWGSDQGWPVLARFIAGPWLGNLVAAAALVSMWGLFNGQLLYVSRLPYVLACDGWLPRIFANVSRDAVAPKAAILTFCALVAVLSALSFGSLAIMQCLSYAVVLTLEFLALIAFRLRFPKAHRSFRVPGGILGLVYVCVTPFAFCVLVLYATLRDWRSFPGQLAVVAAIPIAGLVLYFSRRKSTIQPRP